MISVPELHNPFARTAIRLHETGDFDLVKTVTPTNPGVLKYGRMDGDRFVPLADFDTSDGRHFLGEDAPAIGMSQRDVRAALGGVAR